MQIPTGRREYNEVINNSNIGDFTGLEAFFPQSYPLNGHNFVDRRKRGILTSHYRVEEIGIGERMPFVRKGRPGFGGMPE